MSDFIKIVITSPLDIVDEAEKITRLLESGIDFVHIRKPNSSVRDIRNLIENIPYPLRRKLKLHGHFDLLNDFTIGGVHLNSRCPETPSTALSVSKSCHSIEELDTCGEYAYVTLSPIYDSISKIGYKSKFSLDDEELKSKIKDKNVIALGGVTPEHFPELMKAGFRGAAMMGIVWSGFDYFLNQIK